MGSHGAVRAVLGGGAEWTRPFGDGPSGYTGAAHECQACHRQPSPPSHTRGGRRQGQEDEEPAGRALLVRAALPRAQTLGFLVSRQADCGASAEPMPGAASGVLTRTVCAPFEVVADGPGPGGEQRSTGAARRAALDASKPAGT